MEAVSIPEPLYWAQNFFAVLSACFALTAIIVALLGNASLNWKRTKGLIVISEVHRMSRKPAFFPRIKYEYRVNQRTYLSRILFIGHFIKSYTEAFSRNMANQYPTGFETVIYHHPSFPALSVLQPGINKPIIRNLMMRMAICIIIYSLLTPSVLKLLSNYL